MGKPLRSGTFAKNGATLQFDRYAYASTGGAALYRGVTAGRTQEFFYAGDVLVGLDFLSSFKEDGTDFDDSKISQIQKGHSTKLDVVRLLGNPSGEYIYPLVPQRGDRGLVYAYSQVAGSAFNIKISQKVLIVSYDASGTVTNVDYTATGEKD
jgi:hypothetical protein